MRIPVSLLVVLCASSSSKADLLATYPIWHGGGRQGIIESITHYTYLSEEFAADEGLGTLFEDIVLYDGDTRTDTIASDDDDPEYSSYQTVVTDGLDWWLYDKIEFDFGSQSRFDLESLRWDFADPDHPGPDLHGYAIESVTRTITVELDSPGGDPGGDGNWTDFLVTGTFEIYGQPIPEPASLGLLALSCVALVIRRNRGA